MDTDVDMGMDIETDTWHGHRAWTLGMDIDIENGHEHRNGHGHLAWTPTWSKGIHMDTDMNKEIKMNTNGQGDG
jgi:hypothetical protein